MPSVPVRAHSFLQTPVQLFNFKMPKLRGLGILPRIRMLSVPVRAHSFLQTPVQMFNFKMPKLRGLGILPRIPMPSVPVRAHSFLQTPVSCSTLSFRVFAEDSHAQAPGF